MLFQLFSILMHVLAIIALTTHAVLCIMHSFLRQKGKIMTTSLTIRMDDALKADAEEFFDEIGMSMTTAITCFFKKCLAVGEIPFKLSRQSKRDRLLAALKEADEVAKDPNAPTCTDPDKLEEFMLS